MNKDEPSIFDNLIANESMSAFGEGSIRGFRDWALEKPSEMALLGQPLAYPNPLKWVS